MMRVAELTILLVALAMTGCATRSPAKNTPAGEAEQVGSERPAQEVNEPAESETPTPAPAENGEQSNQQLHAPGQADMPVPGMYKTGPMSPDGFDTLQMEIVIREDLGIHGNVQGSVDGKSFVLPLRGRAQRDGSFKAGGTHGSSAIHLEGTYAHEAIQGAAHGQIFDRAPFQFRFSAQPTP